MEKPMYFRRCHVCGALNHTAVHHHVERCEHCTKPMSQFHYFDDRLSPILSDRGIRPAPLDGEIQPLKGLTVYWEGF